MKRSGGLLLALLLCACGGGGNGGGPMLAAVTPPSAPVALTANVGDGAVSLGWAAVADDGGATVDGYDITLTPQPSGVRIEIVGRRALIRGLANGTAYTASVRARNRVGSGPAAQSAALTPRTTDVGQYQALTIAGDTSSSGIFDPSLLRTGANELWMAYSGVDYRRNAQSQLVQDVGFSLARSTDNGATFAKVVSVGVPAAATVTDTDPARSTCNAATCIGRWVYETSWLIDDASDPATSQRYKLFAHKYFLYPPSAEPTRYYLGAIVMWTAADPAGPWSTETPLIGWNLTPPELTARHVVNSLNGDLANCLVVAEGSAVVRGSTIDFVFACPSAGSGGVNPQKIVLLRTTDRLSTLSYVRTVLQASAAAPLGASFYTAPALVANADSAPVLIVTPAVGAGTYAGCVVFPFADEVAGTLHLDGGNPVAIQGLPTRAGRFGGACTWARGAAGLGGVILNEVVAGTPADNTRFNMLRTGTRLDP